MDQNLERRAMKQARVIDSRILSFVDKYTSVLHISGPRPDLALRSNLGSSWHGRCRWSPEKGTSIIELQSVILGDDRKLESIIAHEMIHHRDFLRGPQGQFGLAPARRGHYLLPKIEGSHGASFMEGARIVNALMGEGFVTEKSDRESYARVPIVKQFFVLVRKVTFGAGHGPSSLRNDYAWQWAARIGPEAKKWVTSQVYSHGARLVTTSDDYWATGAKITRSSHWNMLKDESRAFELLRLYESGLSAI